MPQTISKKLQVSCARVKLFLCDVDGVLTDGTVLIGDGREFKNFNIQDGLGLRLLQAEGIRVGWISNRASPATEQRATELRIDFLHQQKGDKVAAVESILQMTGLKWRDVCYLGDDVVDLGVLKRAGLAVAVANGIAETRNLAHYVTKASGGRGAVREVVQLILAAQRKWPAIVRRHTN